MSRIWITGFRGFELGIFNNKDPKRQVIIFALQKLLRNEIEDGADWLITGGQMGIEQLAIEAALELKEAYPEFRVALMTPFKNFGSQWKEANQAALLKLKTQVDFTSSVSQLAYTSPQQLHDYQNFMLAHTEKAIIFYDEQAEESKARYDFLVAKKATENANYELTVVDFDRLQEFADEYQESQREW